MIKAEVVCDSISPQGKRLLSVGVTAHRFILAEINTHRLLARSYRSSRAVPSRRLIEEVRTNPAMPVHWGANEPGMQANGELSGTELLLVKDEWRRSARSASFFAETLAASGLHKQIANRVLEPYLWVHGVITATEWDNFFGLRLHKSAQPEFRALADAMWVAMRASEPNQLEPGQWHLPYVNCAKGYADRSDASDSATCMDWCREHGITGDAWFDLLIKRSVARCARSSYKSFDTDAPSTVDEDLSTYVKLNIPGTESYDPTQPIHASPAEHQGTPDDIESKMTRHEPDVYRHQAQHGNLIGWRQYRKTLPGEARAPMPEGYA